jgi:hypothetical protein
MLITGHQPNYLPYIGFFHKIYLSDIFVIVDIVQFVKRGPFGWINRNRIRTANSWIWLTVPVKTKDKFYQSILETEIENTMPWSRKHLKSIERNYHQTPYFHKYSDFFYQVYQKKWDLLAQLNEAIIIYLIEALGIKVKIIRASQLGLHYCYKKNESISSTSSATDLIVEICQKLNSDSYLHGKHGHDYLDKNKTKRNKIKSYYQDFHHPLYKQTYEPFIPELSIIDLLFNYGDRSIEIIKNSGKYLEIT